MTFERSTRFACLGSTLRGERPPSRAHPTREGASAQARDQPRGDDPSLRPFVHVVHDRRGRITAPGASSEAVDAWSAGILRVKCCADVCRESDVAHRRVFHGSSERGTGADLRGARMCLRLSTDGGGSRAIRQSHGGRCEKKSPTPGRQDWHRGASRRQTRGGGGHAGQNAGKLARRGGLEAAAAGHGDRYPEASMFNRYTRQTRWCPSQPAGSSTCAAGVDDYEARAWRLDRKGTRPSDGRGPSEGREVCIAYTELYRPAANEARWKSQGSPASAFDAQRVGLAAPGYRASRRDGRCRRGCRRNGEGVEGYRRVRAAYAIGDFEGAVESAERVLESSDGVQSAGHCGSRPDWPP